MTARVAEVPWRTKKKMGQRRKDEARRANVTRRSWQETRMQGRPYGTGLGKVPLWPRGGP